MNRTETLYRDTESGEILTAAQILKEWHDMSEEEQNGRTFTQYLSDCLSKNGFLVEA
ncbi:MAG: hypothetical protein IIW86_05350 [Clostridia bacterium]|nr:hypothetical protein [Clostridia bacterium]